MSKQLITVDGDEQMVREDTAKSFRGVHWAFLSIAAFILIAALLLLTGVLSSTADDTPAKSPAQIESEQRR